MDQVQFVEAAFKKFEVIQADHITSNWSIPEYLNLYEPQNVHINNQRPLKRFLVV